MGTVYEVEHESLGRRFAAKVLTPVLTLDEGAVRRLQNEARAASAIDHDNIVDVTHLGRSDDGLVYVVMELLRGRDLGARLAEARRAAGGRPAPLPDDEVQTIVLQILAGLDAAHRAQIVHRDLKPENVFLAEAAFGPPRAVIVDFGISKLLDTEEAGRLTETGQVLGTPLYMAPEQTGGGHIDGRTDLYSLGVMIYETLTGRPPFDGRNLLEILFQHANRPPEPLGSLRPDLPPEVPAFVHRALAKDPAVRFPDAATMAAAWRGAWNQDAPRPRAPPALLGRRRGLFFGAATAVVAVGLLATGPDLDTSADQVPAPASVTGAGPDAAVTAPGAERDEGGEGQRPPAVGPPPQVETTPRPSPAPAATPEKNTLSEMAQVGADRAIRRIRTVDSVPSGARVFRGDRLLGRTPLDVTLPPAGRIRLELRHPDYESKRVTLSRQGKDTVRVVLQRRPPPLAPL